MWHVRVQHMLDIETTLTLYHDHFSLLLNNKSVPILKSFQQEKLVSLKQNFYYINEKF